MEKRVGHVTDVAERVASFRTYVRRMLHYHEAISLMHWDLRTGAPRKGVELRSEAIGTLAGELFELSVSPELGALLDELGDPSVYPALDRITQAMVREVRRDYERSRKIPPERHRAFVVLTSKAQTVWEEAKAASDFALLKPYLEEIVALTSEFIDYWGPGEHRYDTLLDIYEPGVTVRQLDEIFGQLRTDTVELVEAIVASGKRVDTEPLRRFFDPQRQRQFSLLLLERMGYDFSAGRLDETAHPFESAINRYDVRVTTKFLPHEVRSAIFSTIHEGGHALYEQGISPELIDTGLCDGASYGIHESQSRFWENFIGRSREFWECHYADLLRLFPAELSDVSLDHFHRAVNQVEPSLIRIEADEVTYNLHIMIRYELEKALVAGDLKVADLPGAWREKMREYLGLEPATDAEGVLQDVHWSGGDFGYFPSYALGNIYAAQFRTALARDIPDYLQHVREGRMEPIKAWLNDRIHRHGKLLQPREIVRQVTGEDVNPAHLVAYFKEKFAPLYGL
ncbi:MAG: carboxypeptidase M32 [Alicyclobacillus sp.]|nr:carboxypeptidase M32 [Alicyclobacillus sp.]